MEKAHEQYGMYLHHLTCMHDNTALCLPDLLIFQSTLTHCTETLSHSMISIGYLTLLTKFSLCQVGVNIL